MSITKEQLFCIHQYDKKGYCPLCGLSNPQWVAMQKNYDNAAKIIGNLNKDKVPFDMVSDIHLDFWINEMNPNNHKMQKQIDKFIDEVLIPKTDNILLLGGDQGHYFNQDKKLLLTLLKFYKHILIVPGNHDLYLLGNTQKKRYMLESHNRISEMKALCRETEGLHYMDGDIIVIDGISFGGLGMWHDNTYGLTLGYSKDEIHEMWLKHMNDSRNIYGGREHYTIPIPYGVSMQYSSFKPLELFDKMYEKLQKIHDVNVMLSHYAPRVPDCLPEEFDNVDSSFYYFDGLKDIKRIDPKYWVVGHTHDKYEEKYNNTTIICNPLGYPSENTYTEIITRYV